MKKIKRTKIVIRHMEMVQNFKSESNETMTEICPLCHTVLKEKSQTIEMPQSRLLSTPAIENHGREEK